MLNEEGFSCFKIFWIAVNKKCNKLFQPTEGIAHYLLNDFELEVSGFVLCVEEEKIETFFGS